MQTFIQLAKGIFDLGLGMFLIILSLGILQSCIPSIIASIKEDAIKQYKKENNIE